MPHLTFVPIYELDAPTQTSAAPSGVAQTTTTQTPADDAILALRVGRTDHDVFVGTLRRAGTQGVLCSMAGLNPERPAPPLTDCGRILIEGDGVAFDHILRWLRSPKLPSGLSALTTSSLRHEATHFGLDDLTTELRYHYPLREQVRKAKYALINPDDHPTHLRAIPYVAANICLGNSLFKHGDAAGATKRWTKAYRCCLVTDLELRSYQFVFDGIKTDTVDRHLEEAHRAYTKVLIPRLQDAVNLSWNAPSALADEWAETHDDVIKNILALFPTFQMLFSNFV